MPKGFKYKYKAVGDDISKVSLIGLIEWYVVGSGLVGQAVGSSFQELGNGWYGIVSVRY